MKVVSAAHVEVSACTLACSNRNVVELLDPANGASCLPMGPVHRSAHRRRTAQTYRLAATCLERPLMAIRAGTTRSSPPTPAFRASPTTHLRMALNLLTDDPRQPSGAHWCWTRIVPEMANRLLPGEELHLMVSPSARHYFPD